MAKRKKPRLRKPQAYEWANGSRMRGDPQTFGAYIEAHRAENPDGAITPEQLLEDAQTNPDSPLNEHEEMQMSDRRAAREFRLLHIRKVLRSLVVIYEDGAEPMITRAFVKIANDESHKYTHIHVAMSNTGIQEQVLSQALQEFTALMTKYRGLEALADVFTALNNVVRAHANLHPGRFPGDWWDAQAAQGGTP